MKLGDVLRPEHVVVPLQAATVKEATERLAERLIAAGVVTEPQRLTAVIKHAWPEDMVSVGEHAFLPHFRTEAVPGLVSAVGIAPTPIHWEKDPHRTARVVILIVAPPRETPTYLQVVGAFARALSNPETVLALLAAKSPEQVAQQLAVGDDADQRAGVVHHRQRAHVVLEQEFGHLAQRLVGLGRVDMRGHDVPDRQVGGQLDGRECGQPDHLRRRFGGEQRQHRLRVAERAGEGAHHLQVSRRLARRRHDKDHHPRRAVGVLLPADRRRGDAHRRH